MQIRIQFGTLKGKILRYSDNHQARPTLARARDVLFNWLYRCDNKRCLDLFAGTGVLGLEALSLGAAFVDFIDNNNLHTKSIAEHLKNVKKNDCAMVHHSDALEWLAKNSGLYDLIFLDPPFRQGWLEKILLSDELKKISHPNTLIYLEAERGWTPPEFFKITKQKNLGDVSIYLVTPIID